MTDLWEKGKPLVKSDGLSFIGGESTSLCYRLPKARNISFFQENLISRMQNQNGVAVRLFLYMIFLKSFPQGDHSSLIEMCLYFFYLIIVALNKT